MAKMNFGGVIENVITREEFPLSKALETLKDETIAVIGYGVQGPGQSLNLKDNGFNVIVGQRKNSKTWDKAVADGWVPGKTLFEIEEACERATIIQYLLSDAAQIAVWPSVKKHLTPGKALYFSHGFGATYSDRTGIVPPKDIDVIMIAPKGSGTSLRRLFLQGRGLNSSYAVIQDATGTGDGPRDRAGHRRRIGLSVRDHVQARGIFRPDRRTGYADGRYPGYFRRTVRQVLRENGHTPSEAFNETVEELTQSLMPLVGRERYGLDVRQLLDHGSARRARLVEAFPRCRRKPVFEELYAEVAAGNEAQRSIDSNSKPDYREKLERGVARKCARAKCGRPALRCAACPAKEQIASFLHIPNRSFRESGRTVQQVIVTCCTVHVDE